jgi:hypothetical protein
MTHMQQQITGKQNWLEVETSDGTEFLPAGDLGLFVRDSETQVQPLTDDEREKYKKAIWQYTAGEPHEWKNIQGYGARLSAPGYLDCTDWSVYDTEEEAKASLAEDEDEAETEDEQPQPKTVDITPIGLQTPEGQKRVANAQSVLEDATVIVANTATFLLKDAGDLIDGMLRERNSIAVYHLEALNNAVAMREKAQEEFVRAIAGRAPYGWDSVGGDK